MIRDASTKAHINEQIGPRKVGTVWKERHGGPTVEVLAIDRDPAGWMLWSITEVDLDGSQKGMRRTHCTAWDPRDQVVTP